MFIPLIFLHRRAAATGDEPPSTVQDELAAQWYNPTDIATILLIIGGDVVQKAFAQGTGKPYVPVCFSFGCIAYTFMGLVNVIGDGRIMPPPTTLASFVVSRLLRDLEADEARFLTSRDRDFSLKITVFEAIRNRNGPTQFSWTYLHLIGIFITLGQLGIAAIPWALKGDWSLFLITAVGTVFVQWCGCLPQWTAEKLPTRQQSDAIYALTSGNGSRDIMVIIGDKCCLDLESLAAPHPPRNSRPWEKFTWLSRSISSGNAQYPGQGRRHSGLPEQREAIMWNFLPFFHGVPLGFALTRVTYAALSVLWLCLLVNVAAPRQSPDSWCFLAVGGLGMFQNAWLAAKELRPAMRNLPLRKVDQFIARKVMDGLMDFHTIYGRGIPLLEEFFPGPLFEAEARWWANDEFDDYEQERLSSGYRGTPRRLEPDRYPKYYIKPPPRRRATLAEIKTQAYGPAGPADDQSPTSETRGRSGRGRGVAGIGQRFNMEKYRRATGEEDMAGGLSSSAGSSPTKKG
ncbi:uncharacterized protein PG998_003186 [Apiospora kogelbergensis]|uniref:uncharacterized protein n=1 Tax=Apiospora kogelbergensis TaxID=1337665 RepID=UPI0031304167